MVGMLSVQNKISGLCHSVLLQQSRTNTLEIPAHMKIETKAGWCLSLYCQTSEEPNIEKMTKKFSIACYLLKYLGT